MKMLSDQAVTKSDLTAVVEQAMSDVDAKQAQQIKDLKYALVGSFVVNLVVTVVLFFIK